MPRREGGAQRSPWLPVKCAMTHRCPNGAGVPRAPLPPRPPHSHQPHLTGLCGCQKTAQEGSAPRSSSGCAPRALVEGAARAATTSPLRSCRDELWARGNKAENALHLLGRPCAPTRVLVSCPTCALGAHRPKGCPG